MADEIELFEVKDNKDFSKKVEEILVGIFLLFGKVLATLYDFIAKPHIFSSSILNVDPLANAFPKRYARPITYLFLLMALMSGGFILLFQTELESKMMPDNPFAVLIVDAFKDAELMKLILGMMPFILCVGLYSYTLYWSNKKRNQNISFLNSLHLSCYFAGSVCAVYTAIIPLFPLFEKLGLSSTSKWKIILWPCAVIGWAFLFRCMYSYLVLLKGLTLGSRFNTMKIFFKGFAFFLLFYYLILIWLSPLAFKIIEKEDKNSSEKITNEK